MENKYNLIKLTDSEKQSLLIILRDFSDREDLKTALMNDVKNDLIEKIGDVNITSIQKINGIWNTFQSIKKIINQEVSE